MRIDQGHVGETTLMYANRLVCKLTCMQNDIQMNRPFYSCLFSDLVSEWQRGWRRPCFDTDLTTFIGNQVYLINANQVYLNAKRGLYQSKITSSPAAIQRPGLQAHNCKMAYWRM